MVNQIIALKTLPAIWFGPEAQPGFW